MPAALQIALLSCLLLGLRHGFDYDHLAAITDIASVQRGWREGLRLGFLYALGHALTVAVLGAAVIALHLSIPAGLDRIGERLVGATLIGLAMYVLASMWRAVRGPGRAVHAHMSQSRIALLISGAQYIRWRVRRMVRRDLLKPEPFRFRYDKSSVVVIGVIHGLGAETPSQLMLFLLAANLGGTSRGLLGLLAFLVGLLAMNTMMMAGASGIVLGSLRSAVLQRVVMSFAAVYSFAMGAIFLFGWSGRLPLLAH